MFLLLLLLLLQVPYCAHDPSAPPNHCFTEAWQDQHNGLPHVHTLAQGLE